MYDEEYGRNVNEHDLDLAKQEVLSKFQELFGELDAVLKALVESPSLDAATVKAVTLTRENLSWRFQYL